VFVNRIVSGAVAARTTNSGVMKDAFYHQPSPTFAVTTITARRTVASPFRQPVEELFENFHVVKIGELPAKVNFDLIFLSPG
jgi:hypothetical protein